MQHYRDLMLFWIGVLSVLVVIAFVNGTLHTPKLPYSATKQLLCSRLVIMEDTGYYEYPTLENGGVYYLNGRIYKPQDGQVCQFIYKETFEEIEND
jgi:hypothetical protein